MHARGSRSQDQRGVEILRRTRGDERASFSDIADHLLDFARVEPGSYRTVDALARFLAAVERVDHSHLDGSTGSTADALDAVEEGAHL